MPNLIVRQATIFDLRVLVPLFDGYRVFYERATSPPLMRSCSIASSMPNP